jgi:hypothetical protein
VTAIFFLFFLLTGYVLGRLHSVSNKEVIARAQKIVAKRTKLGVVKGITPEVAAIRRDPKRYREEKEGEEIFDKLMGDNNAI